MAAAPTKARAARARGVGDRLLTARVTRSNNEATAASVEYGLACTLGWYAGIFCRCARVCRFTERDGGAEQLRSGCRRDGAVAN